MHNYYGHLTWQIASILVGGSIAGLALVISNIHRPSCVVSLFAVAVIGTASTFWLYMRRYGKITEIHLIRCREIEACLGMQQHRYVRRAGCKPFTVLRQDGKEEKIKKIPWPTGWELSQSLSIGLIIFGIVVATYYLGYGFLLSLYIGIFVSGIILAIYWVHGIVKERREKKNRTRES